MNEIELTPDMFVEFASVPEKQEASRVLAEIEKLTESICEDEQRLNSRWVLLGVLVHSVRTNKYWLEAGHKNFGEYVEHIGQRVRKGRSQIYQYTTVAEKLLPQIPADVLTEMGITNANELKKLSVSSGKLIPQSVIDSALDPAKTTDQLIAEIAEVSNKEPEEKGKWCNFGGCYFSEDEKKLYDSAYKTATQLDPVIPHDIPSHVQTKEVVLRWCQEFLSTYQEM